MLDRATKWFLRWRDRGDAAALGRTFDLTAPELLRIARNLTRDLADAEDLVQATFLAAIESAARFDRSRRVVAWLVAILTYTAQAERRRRQRAPQDGDDADVRADSARGPADDAAGREIEQKTRDALERLPEPYRQPTLLRVAHGLPPAEIALLLGRSPGTVRAQIHRGLAQLRERLPAGAFALVGAEFTVRGLPSVKVAVLAHATKHGAAAAAAAAAIPTTLTGAFVMSKKTLAAALLVLAGLTYAIARGSAPAASPELGTPTAAAGAHTVAAAAPRSGAPDVATEAAAAPREVAPYDPGPDPMHLRGRVLDGKTQRPIAGALVAVHAPRHVTLLEVQREFGEFGWPLANGAMTSMVEWLRDEPELTAAAIANGARIDYLLPPAGNQQPLTEVHTDADGRFDVALMHSGALVAIEHSGYGARHIPVRRLPLSANGAHAPREVAPVAEETLMLWPVHHVVAQVRTADGAVPAERIDLLLTDASAFPATNAWLQTTDSNGKFAADVAATKVRASSRSRGWIVCGVVTGDDGLPTQGTTELEAGKFATVQVERFGSARLHVTDADTGRPIETIRVTAADEHEFARWCGTFAAKDGWFTLGGFPAEDIATQRQIGLASGFPKTLDATVWSSGYLPETVRDVALYDQNPRVVEVALHRGDLAQASGRVVRGDAPVAGAEVQLRMFRRIFWHDSEKSVLAAITTDVDGAFACPAPPGDYLLEVRVGGEVVHVQPVQVPLATTVDLAADVQVTVEVVDADGHPVANHNCMVNNGSGNQLAGRTGADGRATFGPFAAGTLKAFAPREATNGSWAGEIEASVDAAPGARPVVRLRLPRNAAFRAQLAFEGPAPARGFAGFRARDASYGAYGARAADVAVEPGGSVPIDIRAGGKLLVLGPDGRQWRLPLPDELQANPTLLLRWSGLAYAGVLADDDGRPIAHGRVFATAVGSDATVSASTDEHGAFVLDGLEPRRHLLTFHSSASATLRELDDNRLGPAWFEPAQPPSSPAARLTLRVPRKVEGAPTNGIAMTVHVHDEGGHPVAGASVAVTTLFDSPDGVMQLYPTKSWQYVDSAGNVQVEVARGDRYRASVYTESKLQRTEEWALPAAAASDERTIVLK